MSNFEKSIKYTTTNDYVTISDYFTQSDVEIIPPINPYLILGVATNSDIKTLKNTFRNKISTKDRQQRALLSLAYPILCSIALKVELPKNFQQISSNEFSFDADDPVILTLTGHCKALTDKIDENRRKILQTKSTTSESLLYLACRSGYVDVVFMLCHNGFDINSDQNGSTALHAATFFQHKDLVKFLIESGASIKIKNRFGNVPVQEAIPPLKCLFDESTFDPLTRILQDLLEHPLALKLEHIFFEKEIVAYRIQRKVENRDEIVIRWVRGWHGTKSKFLNSIFQYGLLTPGEKAGDAEIVVLPSHIKESIPLCGIDNWAKAIFISTSVYYPSHKIYSELLETPRGNWRVMVEVGVRHNSYVSYTSTVRSFTKVKGDVDEVEVRIESGREEFKYDDSNNPTTAIIKEGINVVVLAAVLINDDFIQKTVGYANDEKESEKALPDGSHKWTGRTIKVLLNGKDEPRQNTDNSIIPQKRGKAANGSRLPPGSPMLATFSKSASAMGVVRPPGYAPPVYPTPMKNFSGSPAVPSVPPSGKGSSFPKTASMFPPFKAAPPSFTKGAVSSGSRPTSSKVATIPFSKSADGKTSTDFSKSSSILLTKSSVRLMNPDSSEAASVAPSKSFVGKMNPPLSSKPPDPHSPTD